MAPEQQFNPFAPAVKAQLKARVALDGPTGSGKTWTALRWATILAGDAERRENGMAKIAYVDTERDSARLYAPHFTFDHLNFTTPYDVPRLLETLRAAEANGYEVAVVDSLSHFWVGEGGVLDEVDAAASRAHGNKFAGWQTGTPLQRNLVDAILALDMHVIVTMRAKMEYVLEEINGKKVPRKIGMAPVQRDGLEYEFTIVGDMDLEHRMTITKSRCDILADKVIQPHREAEAAETFLAWLNDGAAPPPRADADAIRSHVQAVKGAGAGIITAMQEWMATCGFSLATLTVPQLEKANAYLADLLLEAQPAAVGYDDMPDDPGDPGEEPSLALVDDDQQAQTA